MIENGWILSAAILWPNILWALFRPAAEKEKAKDPANNADTQCPKILQACEQVGRAAIFILPVFLEIKWEATLQRVGLAVAALSLFIYYIGYVRYFTRGRDRRLLYRPLLGIPLPMSSVPVVYFIAGALATDCIWLAAAALVFAAGHLCSGRAEKQIAEEDIPG